MLREMKGRKQSDVVVMDFAKAFDNVSHTRLLHKLHMYRIDPETYVKPQRNLIDLQQILANKKYYEISFFCRTVKDWNSLPKTLLAADSLKAFKAWVISIDHHLPY